MSKNTSSKSHNTFKDKIIQILERWFKTDMRYVLSGGGWITMGLIISSLSSFLLAYFFAQKTTKEIYGSYKFIISLVGILSIATLPGMSHAVTRAATHHYDAVLKKATHLRMRWGIFGSIAAILFALLQWNQNHQELAYAIFSTALIIPLLEPLQTTLAYLNGKKEFRIFSLAKTTTDLFSVLTVSLCLFFSTNLTVLVISYFGAFIIGRLFWYFYTSNHFITHNEDDAETYRIGKHYSIMSIPGILSDHLDKMVIYFFLGPADVAIYAFAMMPIYQSMGYIGNIMRISMPKFAQKSFSDVQKHLPNKLFRLFLLFCLLTIVLISILPYFFQILFPNYTDAVIYAQVASIALIFQFYQVIIFAMMAHVKTKELYIFRFVQPAIQLFALICLLPFFGLWGAVIAFLIGQLSGAVLQLYQLKTK
jgi:O-antigen/teichoic acid export membrane protein